MRAGVRILEAVLLCAVVALAGGAGRAAAAEDAAAKQAKVLYERGMKLYNLSEYQQALDAFKAAYLEKADPVFLFNIGQCYRRMGNHERAADAYRNYLRNYSRAPNRADVEKFILDAEAAIAENARRATQPPIAVQAPHLEGVPVTSEKEAAGTLQAPPPGAPAAAVQEVPAAALPAAPAEAPPAAKKKSRTWVWVTVGVAAAVVAGAAIGVGYWAATRNDNPEPASSLGTFSVFK
jgi:tetratricopeptide (TPR) repeat protein